MKLPAPRRRLGPATIGCLLTATLTGSSADLRWQHFTMAHPLPGTAWGTAGTPLADLDGDGDLDVALSRRDAHVFLWYERRTDAHWIPHVLSDSPDLPQSLGAAAIDLDHDGWPDLAFSQVWFRNPGRLRHNPDVPWSLHRYDGGGHDLLGADIDGDGQDDLVVFDGDVLTWFALRAAPSSATSAPQTDSGSASRPTLERIEIASGIGHHGGLTPAGAGDLDGDGDTDLVVAGTWFANPGHGHGPWQRQAWPHLLIPQASYGTSIRSWVVDLDRDGQQDIVYSDCDTGSGHVYWVRNEGGGGRWNRFPLPDPPTRPGDVPGTGSWHSLAVADFDGDGDLDVFAGEQEDPDTYMESNGKLPMKPRGLKERGVVWLNDGSTPPAFTPQVFQIDNPGWHDTAVGDVDGDGDPDLVTKIWNKDGAAYHADYWRNDTAP